MSKPTCISYPVNHLLKIISCSSESREYPSKNLLNSDPPPYRSEVSKKNQIVTILLEFDQSKELWFNAIKLENSSEKNCPKKFRIEISDNLEIWRAIIQENNFQQNPNNIATWHTPLLKAKYMKMVILEHYKNDTGFYSEMNSFKIGIHGIDSIRSSSEPDRLWTKENIIDKRDEYGWSSKVSKSAESSSIEFDFGNINLVNEIQLKSKNDIVHLFPKDFLFEYSEDGNIWHAIHNEINFDAEPGTWYSWNFLPVNLQFFRIVITKSPKNEEGNYCCQIIETKIFAISIESDHSHPLEGITPHASTIEAGLVKFAKNGENAQNVAVQGNDRRLKDATTHTKGIVRLADNGEVLPLAVVQSHDKRLREATEIYKGIVQLAPDGDIRKDVVVQGNDHRLKESTEKTFGIIKLCPKGESSERKAVQGNDPRLRIATESWPGIVQLAKDGEKKSGHVVQGNDQRLKTATTERLGIIRLAKNGEEKENLIVQSNDKRLKNATENYRGIVQLAKDGETKRGVVIQGNDHRLKNATTETFGITRLAKHDEKTGNLATQADDPRLYNKREPMDHDHGYASLNHPFSEHKGNLWIEGSEVSELNDTNAPQKGKSLLGAKISQKPGSDKKEGKSSIAIIGMSTGQTSGREKIIGILGHSHHTGVRGQALGFKDKESSVGAGIEGHGRDCPGGRFQSRHDYALIAGSENLEDGNPSSGKGILVQGESKIIGGLSLDSKLIDSDKVIAHKFRADFQEPLSFGDLVRIHPENKGTVIKTNSNYDKNVIGVVVNQPSIKILDKTIREGIYIGISGIANVKIDPAFGDIKPGDLLTTSKTPGHAMKANITTFGQIGSLIGKALEEASGKTKAIKVLLSKF